MKKNIVVCMAIVTALVFGIMTGCSGTENNNVEPAGQVEQQQVHKDFDGSGCVDTGDGTFYVNTPDGSSEGGYVPKLIINSASSMVQIGCGTNGMAYDKCVIYIDGIMNDELVTGDKTQSVINLSGNALTPGVHTVEIVKTNDDTVTIYKTAQYEVVV